MPENRLATETSPYLLQHAHDPVDWYPFGDEAFDRARQLDRPVFLSIGYSSCHWCHVMAHESFADEATAAQMNETVVSVKVDREERPDVDSVYMEAVQAATGGGGWPMSVFTTPEGKPFLAGTYFPDTPRHGSPSFRQVLAAVSDAWSSRREEVLAQADSLAEAVASRQRASFAVVRPRAGGRTGEETVVPDRELVASAVARAAARLAEIADPAHGGFGTAPKFPQPLFLDLLLRAHVSGMAPDLDPAPVDVVVDALEAMASGGIWDHLGGGFARYSVDREWLVPHFEKMLYDQALLGRVYLHAWQCTGDIRWRQVLAELVDYVLRDLLLDGGIASSEDADSEGEEGRFYLWTPGELAAALGPELSKTAAAFWGVTLQGNFEGRNVLHRPVRGDLIRPGELEEARHRLFDARSRRTRPGRDTKVIAEWNAMMCSTLAEAALVLGEPAWESAALSIAETLDGELRRPGDGRVLRLRPSSPGEGREILGFASDVACMVDAFTRVGQLTGQVRWLDKAVEVAEQLLELFEDHEEGGLFTSGNDAPSLVVRPKDLTDNVTPAATSTAAVALARLAALSGRDNLFGAAERLVTAGGLLLRRAPTAAPELLRAAELTAYGTVDVAVAGDRADLVAAVASRFEPRVLLAWQKPGRYSPPADSGRSRPPLSGQAAGATGVGERLPLLRGRPEGAAYVCRFGECRLPARSVEDLHRELDAALSL